MLSVTRKWRGACGNFLQGLEALAAVFLRFKPLWLAFKRKTTSHTINRMRKLAVHAHKPLSPQILDCVTSRADLDLQAFRDELEKVTVGSRWRCSMPYGCAIDLHIVSRKYSVGWNDYLDDSFDKRRAITFSGDMVDAPITQGGATEAFFVSPTVREETLLVSLNNYTGNRNVPC